MSLKNDITWSRPLQLAPWKNNKVFGPLQIPTNILLSLYSISRGFLSTCPNGENVVYFGFKKVDVCCSNHAKCTLSTGTKSENYGMGKILKLIVNRSKIDTGSWMVFTWHTWLYKSCVYLKVEPGQSVNDSPKIGQRKTL